MKKAILLLLTLGSFAGAFAQQRSFQQNDNRNSSYQQRSYSQPQYNSHSSASYNQRGQVSQPWYDSRSNATVYVQHNQPSYGNRMSERQRQAEADRINRDYDNRINVYRNNRSLSSYDRNSRINSLQQERNSQLKTIGGALLGAVLGGLIGHGL